MSLQNLYKITFVIIILPAGYLLAQEDGGLEKAKLLMVEGKHSDAIKELNLIVMKDPQNVDALFYLSANYQALSDYLKAAVVLETAVRLKPNNPQLLTALGGNYFSAGLISEADTVLSKAVKLDSAGTQIKLILGKVYMNEKKWDKAAAIYSKLITTDSTNSYFMSSLVIADHRLVKQTRPLKIMQLQ